MRYNDINNLQIRIRSSDIDEVDVILRSVIKRYTELEPENELICLFLPRKNMEERQQILQQVTKFLLSHPTENEK